MEVLKMNCKHEWRQYKNNTVCVKCNRHIIDVLAEQEKYAELGKLTLKETHCYFGYNFKDGDCLTVRCSKDEATICQKRAEILGEIKNETD
jgi:hypothetical protein